jgi:hypothetical protein
MDMPDFMATDGEWKGWQNVMAEWKRTIGTDVDDKRYDPLIKAIEAWGELLVDLRLTQTETQRTVARAEKLGAYLTCR